MKICSKCKIEKDLSCFSKNKWQRDGLSHYCKVCKQEAKRKDYAKNREAYRENQRDYYLKNQGKIKQKVALWRNDNLAAYNARQAAYRARKLNATPPWASLDAIKEIYKERDRLCQETGESWHVDHIIPLNGVNVCGLHCENNLQIIHATENARKSNIFKDEASA
jgi:hypothetical protein